MNIKIKNINLELQYTSRAFIHFEDMTGNSYDPNNMIGTKNQVIMFLCFILGSIEKQKLNITFTWDEYLDFLDDNNDYMILIEFANWFNNESNARYAQLPKEEETDDMPVQKGKKKVKD